MGAGALEVFRLTHGVICSFISNESDLKCQSWIQIALIDRCPRPGIRESGNFSRACRVWVRVNEPMSTNNEYIEQHTARLADCFFTRRKFLSRCGMGFGALSLAGLLDVFVVRAHRLIHSY